MAPSTTLNDLRSQLVVNGFGEKYVDDLISSARGFIDACADMGMVDTEPEGIVDLFRICMVGVFKDECRQIRNNEGRWKR